MFRIASLALVLALAGCSSSLRETKVVAPDLALTPEDESALRLHLERLNDIKRRMEAAMPVSQQDRYDLQRFFGVVAETEAMPDIERELY